MMLYPSMSDLLKKVPNRYALVNVAAKRARDIAANAEEDPDIHLEEKPVSMALDDIMNDRIVPARPVEETEQAEDTAEGENEEQ